MPYNTTTGVFTRTSNSFSDPVTGTVIDPDDADDLFDDYDAGGLSLAFGRFGTVAESTVTAATTTNIGASDNFKVLIDGAATITSLGSVASKFRVVRFNNVGTLTHNATTLILPGGQGISYTPGDTGIFASDASGNWRCWYFLATSRIKLSTSVVIYVATTGSDSNSGLAAGSPKLTLNAAYNLLRNSYDLQGWQAIISIADGTYTAGLTALGPIVGAGVTSGVQVVGNLTTPTNVIIKPTSGYAVYVSEGARVYLRGVELSGQNSNTDLIYSGAWSRLTFDTIVFGYNIGGHDIQAGSLTEVSIIGNYKIAKPRVQKTCTLTTSDAVLACADTADIVVGMGVTTAAGTDFAAMTYVVSIITNTSVTVNTAAAVLGTGSQTVNFTTGGLSHIQADPGAQIYTSTSIGDGGSNQLVVDTTANAYYSNFFISGNDARLYLARLAFLTKDENVSTTATFSSGTTNITVDDGSLVSNGWLVVHPSVPWGTTVSSGGGTDNLVLSANTTAAATDSAIAFGTLVSLQSTPFVMYEARALLDSRMTGTLGDNTTLPGRKHTFNASFTKGSNVITVSAGDAAALSLMFSRLPGYRGLVIQNSFIPNGAVIPDANSISGTNITISQAVTSGSGGVVSCTAAGFMWQGGQLATLRGPPVLSGNYLPTGVVLGGKLLSADFNVTTDQAITIHSPTPTYRILAITVSNASVSLANADGGLYTAAAKGGYALVPAATTYTALTAAAVNAIGSSTILTMTSQAVHYDLSTIYFSLTGTEGSPATADIYIYIFPEYQ